MGATSSSLSGLSQQTAKLDRRHAERAAERRQDGGGEERGASFSALLSENLSPASAESLSGAAVDPAWTESADERARGAVTDAGGLQSLAWWSGWTPSAPPPSPEASAADRGRGAQGAGDAERGTDSSSSEASSVGATRGTARRGGGSSLPLRADADSQEEGGRGKPPSAGGRSAVSNEDDATSGRGGANPLDERGRSAGPAGPVPPGESPGEKAADVSGAAAVSSSTRGDGGASTDRGLSIESSAFAGAWSAAQRAESSASAVGGSPASSGASAQAVLNTEDPGFAQAVALKVAQWSGEGIQQATLDLHPAELGPIRIHIDVEGREARVHFGAAHERTRALLDEAVPALALALQADGLNLAASQVTDVVQPKDPAASAGFGGEGRSPESSTSSSSGSGGGDGAGGRRSAFEAPASGGPSGRRSLSGAPSDPTLGRSADPDPGAMSPVPGHRGRLALDLYA